MLNSPILFGPEDSRAIHWKQDYIRSSPRDTQNIAIVKMVFCMETQPYSGDTSIGLKATAHNASDHVCSACFMARGRSSLTTQARIQGARQILFLRQVRLSSKDIALVIQKELLSSIITIFREI
eukprot:5303557-Amphidinium_carterae.1